jgi:hypothetical protein
MPGGHLPVGLTGVSSTDPPLGNSAVISLGAGKAVHERLGGACSHQNLKR